MTDLKNSMESFKTRLSHAEERIRDLEDRSFDITQSEDQKEKKRKRGRKTMEFMGHNKKTFSTL